MSFNDSIAAREILDEIHGPCWERLHYAPGGQVLATWQRVLVHMSGLRAFKTIIVRGGKKWIHVSLSRPDCLPTYNELALVKYDLIGPKRKAIMVLPSIDQHVNVHPYCLHLFAALGADDGLPDFRDEDGLL